MLLHNKLQIYLDKTVISLAEGSASLEVGILLLHNVIYCLKGQGNSLGDHLAPGLGLDTKRNYCWKYLVPFGEVWHGLVMVVHVWVISVLL